ncbi:ABC transporter permease [Streptosporangium sp. NPDC002721]|uniref:ABC transporter permease n=1 Tax=Streptosporangium sp. NPDC002721 TaxID=3366188 RepID=UPI0036920EC8
MSVKFLRDTGTVFSREFAPVLREPLGLLFTMGQPLLFLFLFGPLLGGTRSFDGQESPWQWFVPGILIMMCLTGPMMAGYSLLIDLIGGSMERMLVTPLNRTAMLVGRTMKEFAILLAQAVLIIVLAVPLGFRPHLTGVLAGLAVLVVFGVGLGALSFALAIASSPGGDLFYGVTQMVMFPLMLLSGVLLPTDYGPGWLQTVAALNPVSYVVEAERALFSGRFADMSVLYGTLCACVVAAAGLAVGTRAMRRAF